MPLRAEKQSKINKLFEAKSLTDIEHYTKKGSKTEGVTSGYIAEKDDHIYMIKTLIVL